LTLRLHWVVNKKVLQK